jgi:hypothetical protein
MALADESPTIYCRIIAYERGQLSKADEIALFQELVDTGMAWQLENDWYARTAKLLLDAGVIHPAP